MQSVIPRARSRSRWPPPAFNRMMYTRPELSSSYGTFTLTLCNKQQQY